MSAVFADLHDVVQVLTEHIREETGIDDVQPGAPRDVAATTVAGARITFLYATPQPGHRSDPVERQGDGSRRFPPLALSCFYVVSTSGADGDDPIAAHHALGQIMTLYHDQPSLRLPLSDGPGAFSELGEGTLNVVQVPLLADQVDKIWTSFDLPLQPWALFEASPVNLVSPRPDLGPAPVVAPGGVRLAIRAGTRPVISRVTPEAVRPTGRVRIDLAVDGALERATVGGRAIAAGDPALVAAGDGSPILLDLDAGLPEPPAPGAQDLVVQAAGLVSRRATLRIAPPGSATVDAPAELEHDPTTDLVLTGANLAGATEALLWPDGGLTSPADIHHLAVSGVGAASVTVADDQLATLPPGHGPWRLTLAVGGQVFTPYVVLELTS